MIRSFFELRQVDPGFNPQNTVTAHFSLPETRYPNAGSVSVFYDELLERIWSISGVRALGLVSPPWCACIGSTKIPPARSRYCSASCGTYSASSKPLSS